MLKSLSAATALDAYFLEARSKLLDLAGILDRIDRGEGTESVSRDMRLEKIHQAIRVLGESDDGRAERLQRIFSLEYDPNWKRPEPK